MIELMLFDAKVTYNDKDGWKCSNPDVLSLVQSLASEPSGFQYVPWEPLTVVEKLQERFPRHTQVLRAVPPAFEKDVIY